MRKFDVKVKKANTSPKVPPVLPMIFALLRQLPFGVWIFGGLVLAVMMFGTPHLLISYTCHGWCGKSANHYECAYFGVQGMRRNVAPYQGRCSGIKLMLLDL